MSEDIRCIQAELEGLGYITATRDSGQGTVVEFDYHVETGSKSGKQFRIGVSMQKTGYPEYPPHWIHVSPPVDDGLKGSMKQYSTEDGREWVTMSRPPGDLWDQLANNKHMRHYLDHHLRKFWSRI